MKRMWSKNELKNIADKQAKEVKKNIDTLVDANGHERFIEGDITINEVTGVSKIYGKWSLSGTHLLIVLALGLTENISSANVANINLPKWIKDKVVPIAGSNVISTTFPAYSADASSNVNCYGILRKVSEDLYIISSCNINSIERNVRIQFDLLIDNE